MGDTTTTATAHTCRHCGRTIRHDDGRWIDPEATGDDAVWRETCDTHDTFGAEHEPSPTRDSRLRDLVDEYPSANGDGYAGDGLHDDPKQYALIERNDGPAGGYWLSTHDTLAAAGHYSANQESAGDWFPLGILDLDSGEEVGIEREFVAVIDGVPADGPKTGVGPDTWPTMHVDGIEVALGRAPDGVMVVQIDGADDLHGETDAGPVLRVRLNDEPVYAGGEAWCNHDAPGTGPGVRCECGATIPKTDRPEAAVATFPDRSQVLITRWPDGTVEVARRDGLSRVWGPPVSAETGR